MTNVAVIRTAIGAIATVMCTTAHAQLLDPEAQAFSFQARLVGPGIPQNGTVYITVSIYDDPVAPSVVSGPHTLMNQSIADSVVSVTIPGINVGAFDGSKLWVGVRVNMDPELTPRVPLIAVPYALRVHRVGSQELDNSITLGDDSANGLLLLRNQQGADTIGMAAESGSGGAVIRMRNAAGEPRIDLRTHPDAEFAIWSLADAQNARAVSGTASSPNGTGIGVYGESAAGDGKGVYGLASSQGGATYGVYGQTDSSSGIGVGGVATSTRGITAAVYAENMSEDGFGVMALARSPTGYNCAVSGRTESVDGTGVRGIAAATSGLTIGVEGRSAGNEGRGVYGEAASLSGPTFGVSGHSASTSGRGVYGQATHSDGFTYGGEFVSQSWEGTGVLGKTTDLATDLTVAVRGVNLSPSAVGVLGQTGGTAWYLQGSGVAGSSDSIGVYGRALATSGTNYGVRGRTDSVSGYGLYSEGNCHIAGTLSKSGGSFKIDHPLDPENKYLSHSFVESPDMMNVYNGNVTTDADGLASVNLPEYFETLNRDFRYQLTVIGQFAQAIVAEEIRNNNFVIQTDKPLVKVSWQVTGIRRDPWAEQNRIRVEEEKLPEHKGKYLNPELYGKPQELAVHHVPAMKRAAEEEPEK